MNLPTHWVQDFSSGQNHTFHLQCLQCVCVAASLAAASLPSAVTPQAAAARAQPQHLITRPWLPTE